MTVNDLMKYLESAPQDSVVLCYDDAGETGPVTIKPQVVWWSDDRKTTYLGML